MTDDNIVPFDPEAAARHQLHAAKAINDRAALRRKVRRMKAGDGLDGIPAGGWTPDELGLPPGCPVQPLGHADGTDYVLSANGCIATLRGSGGQKEHIAGLFGDFQDYLNWAWPRKKVPRSKKDKPVDVENFDSLAVYRTFVSACARLFERHGPFDKDRDARGRGVWLEDDGSLVVHLGDRLLVDGELREPGTLGARLYPERRRLAPPAEGPVPAGDGGPAEHVLEELRTWNWLRPDLDPILLLGWICQAYMSGTLRWRATVWLVGGAGSGKSTALELCQWLLCDLASLSGDASAAAIYRDIGGDAGAVILDEQEGLDERKSQARVELARQANSGTIVGRAGGPNGRVEKFLIQASFLFAAISPPSMNSADYSRMARLELRPIERRRDRGQWADPRYVQGLGQELFRRMIDHAGRLGAVADAYRSALMAAGHNARGGDTFGILLACAHVALYDDPPDAADLAEWSRLLAPATLAELEMASANWADAWDLLLAAQPDCWRNKAHRSIGGWLNAWREGRLFAATDMEGSPIVDFSVGTEALRSLRDELALVGCGIIMEQHSRHYDDAMLFVPSLSSALEHLVRGSAYSGRGKLTQALRQMPETWIKREASCRVGGRANVRGIAIRLREALPRNEDDSTKEATI